MIAIFQFHPGDSQASHPGDHIFSHPTTSPRKRRPMEESPISMEASSESFDDFVIWGHLAWAATHLYVYTM